MRKLILTALSAVLVFALFAGVASARNGLSSSPANSTVFIENMEFSGGFGTVRCNITMTVAMNSSVAKRVGAVAGHTTVAVSTGRCASGDAGIIERGGARVTGLQGPYEVTYQSFGGELPNITEVTLQNVGVHFWIREPTFGVVCESSEPINGTSTGGNPATGQSINRSGIALGGSGCSFASGTMRGSGSIYTGLEHTVRQTLTISLV